MGHRMEIYASEELVDDIIEISEGFDIEAKVIGYVERSAMSQVTIETPFGEFIYN